VTDFSLNTAVVFIIFNRPDTTGRVFEAIARAKPPILLVIADGPRNEHDEQTSVAATRKIIAQVDWDCDVRTLYSDHNMGCRERISTGIDWVFEQVEEAIILEDDCLPHPSFFQYCQELLHQYKNDPRVGMISGDNFQFGHRISSDSYYFSNIGHIWGWATWKDRWQNDYDMSLNQWPKFRDENRITDWFTGKAEQLYFSDIYEKVYTRTINTSWDYQWNFGRRLNNRVSIIPNVNLISNIGFGVNATNTTSTSRLANIPSEAMLFPMQQPTYLFPSSTLDTRYFQTQLPITFMRRIRIKLANLIQRAMH